MSLDSLKKQLIINNEVDQKNFDYLIAQVDQVAIEYAINELESQNKRPYLSNIFKLLDIPPRH
ncbi:hypothetical protein GO864_17620 [Acinetobacter baumannii]|nr:hypothetical protein [Acinetobacter baumannii]OIB66627.1 hypothetical protein A7L34_12325 [Acinetobacter baumannii]OIE94302.1 hypothetical protein A7L81_18870 [Acinetobacter baumannii]OIF15427.1 hypothetical protein A7L98_09190 [Acinetobacter baumannii]